MCSRLCSERPLGSIPEARRAADLAQLGDERLVHAVDEVVLVRVPHQIF